jgi:hypothetical protein
MTIAGREFLFGGDIITTMNDTRLSSPERLGDAMRALKVGDTLRLTVFRAGEYLDVEYVLPERPLLPGDGSGRPAPAPAGGDPRRSRAARPGAFNGR